MRSEGEWGGGVRTWERARLWSRRVRQEKFSLGMEGADLEAIKQLVLAGFPTTSTYERKQKVNGRTTNTKNWLVTDSARIYFSLLSKSKARG